MNIKEIQDKDLEIFLSKIEKECSDILSIIRKVKKFLYRGIRNQEKDYFVFYPKENRKPKHTPSVYNDLIVDFFDEMGVKANRNNSVFVTSNSSAASFYGKVYIVFPSNGYNYSWTAYSDLYVNFLDEISDMFYEDKNLIRDGNIFYIKKTNKSDNEILKDFVKNILPYNDHAYKIYDFMDEDDKKNLNKVIQHIFFEKFFYHRDKTFNKWFSENFENFLNNQNYRNRIKNILKNNLYNNEKIEDAIFLGYEILFNNCKFYAIEKNFFIKNVKNTLWYKKIFLDM